MPWSGDAVSFSWNLFSSFSSGKSMFVGGAVVPVFVCSRSRPAPKNQTRSFQSGPPSVASQIGVTSSVRSSPTGVDADHPSLTSVDRREPLNAFPPAFVTTFTVPPANLPYSAVIPEVCVVISATASST